MSEADLMMLAVAIPLIGTLLILLSKGRPNQRETVTLMTVLSLLAVVLALLPVVYSGGRPEAVLFTMLPGLDIRLELEPLGMMFACIASGLWIVNSIYSIGYMRARKESNQTRFYACFAIAISGAMGVAMAGNMLTLFVFYEVLTLSTYPLVTHSGTPEAVRSGRTYLGLLLGSSILFLFGAVLWTWSAAGTLDFMAGGILAGKIEGPALGLLLFLYMYGIGKAALMPIHRWLPAAMVAPTPVSALLHAVAVVKAGVFTVLKVIVYIFGADYLRESGYADWLMYVAGASLLLASLVALTKDNLKAPTRLFDGQSACLRGAWRGAAGSEQYRRRRDAYRDARFWKNHAVLLRRGDLCGVGKDRDQRYGWHWPGHAGNAVRLLHRESKRHRTATDGRRLEQVLPGTRCDRSRPSGFRGRADDLVPPQHRLSDAGGCAGIFYGRQGRRRFRRHSRGAHVLRGAALHYSCGLCRPVLLR